MIRSIRPAVLIALLVAVACTDQPTEPTTTLAPFEADLGPPPADVATLSASIPGAGGGPVRVDLGFWESPAVAKIIVSGSLTWSGPDNGVGFYPGSSGELDDEGMWIPSQGNCASQLSVRIDGYGPVGGAFGYCPATWLTIGTGTQYAIVSGSVYAVRTSPAPGACFYGGTTCATLTGTQQVSVDPLEANLTIKLDTTVARPGQVVGAQFGVDPVVGGDKAIPWSLREIRFEGAGPIVGGGTPKGCESWFSNSKCGIRVFQSGYVVAEGIANGKLKTERQWIHVVGGDSLPPQPPDTIPTDTIPSDSTHGGGGGGGCGAPSLRAAAGPMRDCDPPPSKIRVLLAISRGLMSPLVTRASFDAVNQTNFRVVRGAREDIDGPRPDTMTVKVVLRREDNGEVVPNAAVLLTAAPIDSSGGHIHTRTNPRPVGSFFLDGENSQIRGPGTHRGQVTLTTNDQGEASVVYRSSGLAGRERFVATLQSGGTPVGPDTAAIVLKVQGLTEMDSSVAGRYAFKPQDEAIATQRHGNHNRWVQAAFKDSVLLIFKDYFTNGGTVQDPDAGNAFYITDTGLEWGGLYDVSEDGEWSSPHQTHRLGVDMDIRSSTIPDDDQDILQEACRGTDKHPRPRVIRCTFESTGPAHLHIEGFYP